MKLKQSMTIVGRWKQLLLLRAKSVAQYRFQSKSSAPERENSGVQQIKGAAALFLLFVLLTDRAHTPIYGNKQTIFARKLLIVNVICDGIKKGNVFTLERKE